MSVSENEKKAAIPDAINIGDSISNIAGDFADTPERGLTLKANPRSRKTVEIEQYYKGNGFCTVDEIS